MFKKFNLSDFNKELSSKSTTPGGGTVAAYFGVLSSALTQMIYNLTIDKDNTEEMRYELKSVLLSAMEGIKTLNKEYQSLMEKETKSTSSVLLAFKLPKKTDNDKSFRDFKIQEGYKKELEIPLEIARKVITLYEYIFIACRYGNKTVISEAGVAALAAQTAMEGSILTVKMKIKNIEDKDYITSILNECNELITEGRVRRDDILQLVEKEILDNCALINNIEIKE